MASDNRSTIKKVFGIIGTVIFFISYIPFIAMIEYGVHGIMAGLFGGPYIYGFEAVANCFLWLCFIPVYPVCFVYQLFFGVLYIRKHKRLKIITVALVSCIVAGILIAGFSFEIKKSKRLREVRADITDYLTDKYGEGVADEADIKVLDYDDGSYTVTSPVLPEHINYEVISSDGFIDTLPSVFVQMNPDYKEAFEAYLDEVYDLPEGYHISVRIESIYFGDYRDGDDYEALFERTQYGVDGIMVNTEHLDDDSVIELINNVYHDVYPEFEGQLAGAFYTLYIMVDGDCEFRINNYPNTGFAYISYGGDSELNGEHIDLM